MVIAPPLLWLLIGLGLCAVEALVPTAFVAFVMGVGALVVAIAAFVIPNPLVQVVLWGVVTGGLLLLSRRWLARSRPSETWDAVEAETLTDFLPDRPGRVLYEGGSWRAIAADPALAIAAGQRVYVIGRTGTTLLILPHPPLADLPPERPNNHPLNPEPPNHE
ncbi:MAG: NfeD family protein [Cyanobacteria bacterium]|nr:NfeD family protein [Cyanobacteriota bacterium]